MAGNKKPRKKYVPGRSSAHVKLRAQPWKIHAVFEPIEAILDEIEHSGTVSVTEDGTPIFSEMAHNEIYEFVPSLGGLIEAFDLHAERNSLPIVTEPLKRMCVKLDKGQMLDQFDMADCRRSIALLKGQSADMEAEYAYKLIRDIQIKFEIEGRQEAVQLKEAA